MKTKSLARPFKTNIEYYTNLKFSIIFSFLISIWLSSQTVAQSVNTYNFNASARPYVPLSGGTTIPALRTDEAISPAITLPFIFNFAGNYITQLYASSNGFLAFPGIGASPNNDLLNASSSSFNVIAPFWDNLEGGAMTSSVASYKTTGAIGSRVFTFEWFKWQWVSTNAALSFQVLLYEGSNKI